MRIFVESKDNRLVGRKAANDVCTSMFVYPVSYLLIAESLKRAIAVHSRHSHSNKLKLVLEKIQ